MEYFKGGLDYNGYGWKCDNETFKQTYGFDYRDDNCMMYFYPCGVRKALRILADDSKVEVKQEAVKLLQDGLQQICRQEKKEIGKSDSMSAGMIGNQNNAPILNLTITLGESIHA